eukprot:TRINITY_DN51369_c0_g1_i1.p1 TRINITY_DN51369_c0_g1~~TRINITY_DN51369_c0_g1_i1.p1  ORF type:complete len:584 (+),score=163.26 TRINITY_DN51369_c0_g1_i1:84-1835(+)
MLSAIPAAVLAISAVPPTVTTPLGAAVGSWAAEGVERYGGIPYALPPLGQRRFARAELDSRPWAGGRLDAARPGPPCIQNPAGDPRDSESESGPPSEDCLHLNIWRPASAASSPRPLPVLVYQFGGGLCSGFAGSNWFNGSLMASRHNVIFVTVSYRLGALGYIVGDDAGRPGSGGLNGVHDNIVALQWLNKYIAHFGGDPANITVSGQSSGAYSLCMMCVAPAAKGLFHRAALMSGPCFGGVPGKTWGPGSEEKGRNVTAQIMAAHGAATLDDLRKLDAEAVQWPAPYMNDLDKAPYFSGYFEDRGVVPGPAEELWRSGAINPAEVLVDYTSKDGTAAFYGTAPTQGRVYPDDNTSTAEGYRTAMQTAWGADAAAVLRQYPLREYPTASAAYVQADADAYVICPSRRLIRHAARAGRAVYVSEFAHFQPAPTPPEGCSTPGALGCVGWGCDNGVELDVVPGWRTEQTKLWASHGSSYHFVFGTEGGPDGLGPPNNRTSCAFDAPERALSAQMMAYWASFVRSGEPNSGRAAGALRWPPAVAADGGLSVLRLSVEATDGAAPQVLSGMNTANCDFWDSLHPAP